MSVTAATSSLRERWLASLREAGLLLLVACALGTLLWAVRPQRLSLRADRQFYAADLSAPLVSVPAALELYEAGTHYFIDTRPGEPDGSIPGSFRIREQTFADDLYENHEFLYPEDPLILYGDGNLQQVSALAARLQERGFTQVTILRGGLAAWRAADGPTTGEASE